MSYLDNHENRFSWVGFRKNGSLRFHPGCTQCGSELDINAKDHNFSGKCVNCQGTYSDEDEVFDELED